MFTSSPRLFGGYLRQCWSMREIPKCVGRWGSGKTLAFLTTRITEDRVILSVVFSLNMAMISGAAVAIL